MKTCDIHLDQQEIELFWSRVDVRGENECWLWKAGKHKDGYGHMKIKGKMFLAHRISFVIFNKRQIVQGMVVAHKPIACHNRLCCNPSHIRETTQAQNVLDKIIDGTIATGHRNGLYTHPDRRPRSPGEKNGNAKLTAKQVEEIRELCKNRTHPQWLIAKMYGVSKQLISCISSRRLWNN